MQLNSQVKRVLCFIQVPSRKATSFISVSEFHLIGFSVFCRGRPLHIAEGLGEIAGGGESKNGRNLRRREVCLGQKPFSFPNTAVDHIVDGRDPILPLKGMGHVIFIDADLFRQLIQCDVFFVMVVDIPFYRRALAVGRQLGMNRRNRNAGVTGQLHHNDVHICLTKN